MDCTRYNLLAGAALTADKDRRVGFGNALDQCTKPDCMRMLTDERARSRGVKPSSATLKPGSQ